MSGADTDKVDIAFSEAIEVWLSKEQKDFLLGEVLRRRTSGQTSEFDAARGNNKNVNMGMLIREAIERQYDITKAAA